MEPPEDDKGGSFKFNPEPRTLVEAKSVVLPIILLIDIGPVVSLADMCYKNAKLATKWLCGDEPMLMVGGYLFAVLECDGDCAATYAAFQRMIQEMWRNERRETTIVAKGPVE
jgi:hypothetical protein